MTTQNYTRIKQGGVPIYMWDKGVGDFDAGAVNQLVNISRLPFIHKHVSAMPDAHLGYGACIGAVIATKGAIIPSAVGVDIGCGVCAIKTSLTANDLPDSLAPLRSELEAAIPVGMSSHSEMGNLHFGYWASQLSGGYDRLIAKHGYILEHKKAHLQLGTLGGGNHFIEICLDEHDDVWIMLHSGSRGIGNRIGTYFIRKAKEEAEKYFIGDYLPDKDLSYLVEHTENFDDYIEAVSWAQDYARINRSLMLKTIKDILRKRFKDFFVIGMAVNCHHNYVERENHYGENVWVTRKGAVRARQGDLGIIPGSMGTGSFIVEGLGSKDSFHSCSHGAGRVMSRTQAKKVISQVDHIKAMKGIEARLDTGVLDESPAAYKSIIDVMRSQEDLVKIKYSLNQVLNIKG